MSSSLMLKVNIGLSGISTQISAFKCSYVFVTVARLFDNTCLLCLLSKNTWNDFLLFHEVVSHEEVELLKYDNKRLRFRFQMWRTVCLSMRTAHAQSRKSLLSSPSRLTCIKEQQQSLPDAGWEEWMSSAATELFYYLPLSSFICMFTYWDGTYLLYLHFLKGIWAPFLPSSSPIKALCSTLPLASD